MEGDGFKSKAIIPMKSNGEDVRREAALASAAPLQPTFKPPLGVSHQQLSKFQELHRRRLLIKSKSMKYDDKSKGKKGKHSKKMTPDAENCIVSDFGKSLLVGVSGAVCSEQNKSDANTSLQSDDGSANNVSKKHRQKLHWGLDTKDRWEMKANM